MAVPLLAFRVGHAGTGASRPALLVLLDVSRRPYQPIDPRIPLNGPTTTQLVIHPLQKLPGYGMTCLPLTQILLRQRDSP